MSVAGIDFGSKSNVVALARRKGIDVVMNEESKRETPSLINFGDKCVSLSFFFLYWWDFFFFSSVCVYTIISASLFARARERERGRVNACVHREWMWERRNSHAREWFVAILKEREREIRNERKRERERRRRRRRNFLLFASFFDRQKRRFVSLLTSSSLLFSLGDKKEEK